MARDAWWLGAVLALTACTKVEIPQETNTANTAFEGDAAGECTDGADNDIDGYYDCGDIDCWGSPDCADQDADADTDTDADADADADTDTDTDADTDADTEPTSDDYAPDVSGFDLTYTLEWDITGDFEDLAASFGIVDCLATYVATSDERVARTADYITFWGSWNPTKSDCGSLTDVIWTDETRDAYATFRFKGAAEELDTWLQHDEEDEVDPYEKPYDEGQWYITNMDQIYDPKLMTIHHTEEESTTIEGLIPITLYHTVDITFR